MGQLHWPGWRGFETGKTCRERTGVGTAELSWHRLTIATLAHLLGRRGLSICTCNSYPTQEDCESFEYRKLKLLTWFAHLSMMGRHRLVKPEGRQSKQTTHNGRLGIHIETSVFSGHFQFRCFWHNSLILLRLAPLKSKSTFGVVVCRQSASFLMRQLTKRRCSLKVYLAKGYISWWKLKCRLFRSV